MVWMDSASLCNWLNCLQLYAIILCVQWLHMFNLLCLKKPDFFHFIMISFLILSGTFFSSSFGICISYCNNCIGIYCKCRFCDLSKYVHHFVLFLCVILFHDLLELGNCYTKSELRNLPCYSCLWLYMSQKIHFSELLIWTPRCNHSFKCWPGWNIS